MKTRLAEAAFALTLSAGTAFADTIDADALVVDLSAGVTNTIAEALQAIDSSYTIAMLNGGELKSRQIVKNGEGTLKFDTAISNYAGRIFIREGVAVCNVQYGMGTGSNGSAASGTEVADGATLVMDASAQTANWTAVEKERIAFAGNGYAGGGAIWAINRSKNSTWALGYCPILTGDATLKMSSMGEASSAAAFGTDSYGTLDLNGKTLTLVGLTSNWSKPWFNLFRSSMTPGHLLVSNAVFMVQTFVTFQGGAENTLTLGEEAVFRPSLTDASSFPWTLVSDNPRAFMVSRAATTYQILGDGAGIPNVNTWGGPVRLGNDLPLCTGDKAYVRHNWAFTGKVSGEGGFSTAEHAADHPFNYTTNINLHLSNPQNDFAGEVSLDDNWNLYLYENGALPSAGGGVSMLNGALHLLSTNVYELPSASFESTAASRSSRVLGGRGRWTGPVVKTGSESLGYYSAVGGPLLDVRAGSVKFAKGCAGMFVSKTTNEWNEATVYCNNAFGREDDPYKPSDLAYFKPVALTVSASPFFSSSVWRKYSAWRCWGYLVNDGDDASWTFAAGASHGQRILFDGEQIMKQYQFSNPCVYKPSAVTVPVSHGVHFFEIRAIARSDDILSDPNRTEGFGLYDKNDVEGSVTNWHARAEWCGLLVDRQGRGSKNYYDYEPLLDSGDGSIFLATTNEAENAAFVPAFDKLKFAAGTSLDLNGHDYTMNDLEGFPSVAGGNLCITGKWSVAAAALQGGSSMAVAGNVTFGPSATIDITWLAGVQLPATFDVVSATGVVSGTPTVTEDGMPSERWMVTASGNKLTLTKSSGLLLIFR